MGLDLKELFAKAFDRNVVVYDECIHNGTFSQSLVTMLRHRGRTTLGCGEVLFYVTSRPVSEPVTSHYEPDLYDWYVARRLATCPGCNDVNIVRGKYDVVLVVFANGEPLLGAY